MGPSAPHILHTLIARPRPPEPLRTQSSRHSNILCFRSVPGDGLLQHSGPRSREFSRRSAFDRTPAVGDHPRLPPARHRPKLEIVLGASGEPKCPPKDIRIRSDIQVDPQTGRSQTKNHQGGAHKPAETESDRFRLAFWLFRPRSETFEL